MLGFGINTHNHSKSNNPIDFNGIHGIQDLGAPANVRSFKASGHDQFFIDGCKQRIGGNPDAKFLNGVCQEDQACSAMFRLLTIVITSPAVATSLSRGV